MLKTASLIAGSGGVPVLEVDGTFTPTDSSGAALTFSVATGFYRKVGKLVYIWGQINYPVTADASQSVIGSLPFTASNSGTNQVGIVWFLASVGASTAYVVNKNTATMSAANVAANTAVLNSAFTAKTIIYFGSYPTDT